MNRTGLIVALAVAAVVGLVFGFYPELDLTISRWFFNAPRRDFTIGHGAGMMLARDVVQWLVAAIAAVAFIAVLGKLLLPWRRMLIPGRAALLMIATLALGPGLVTNVILKDNWGRPRPIDVTEFNGADRFVPWWDPRGQCPKNCSFVAGEPSGAFWTLAPAALAPPPWRAAAYAGALTFGAGVGLMRIAVGSHFFSDVVFAGVFTFLIIWLAHGLVYRWRATRLGPESVERALERLARPGYDAVAGWFMRLRGRGMR